MSKEIPIIPIKLDKQRNIKLTGRAFVEIEKLTGKNTFQSEIWETMSTTDVLIILWQGLLHEDPGLTLEDVEDMYHPGVMSKVINAIQAAWIDAVDVDEITDDKKAKVNPTKQPAS